MKNSTNITDVPVATVVVDKKTRFPNLNKLIPDDFEEICLGSIDEFYLRIIVDKEHSIVDTPDRPWFKFFSKTHDPESRLFCEFDCPFGSKRRFGCKKKIVQGSLPTLKDLSDDALKKKRNVSTFMRRRQNDISSAQWHAIIIHAK